MIATTLQPDGRWLHVCTRCRSARINRYERYRWPCDCKRPEPIGRTPAAERNLERRARYVNLRTSQPCYFLGSATGKTHKVGCYSSYLPEYYCRCPSREPIATAGRNGARVLTPRAIPQGRCRDLEIYRGAVAACVDCVFYRAALLAAPTQ